MQARFDEALRVLTRHEVEFIVVGGIAAVLQGVLELEAIIETKEHADRPKDRYQLPFLRQLLTEIRRLRDG